MKNTTAVQSPEKIRKGEPFELFYAYADDGHMHITRCTAIEEFSESTSISLGATVSTKDGQVIRNYSMDDIHKFYQRNESDARKELLRMTKLFAPHRIDEVASTPITDNIIWKKS